jgi:UDP-glucose:(heptosyl)LPS alpha-1,3-glucosyltransferase
MKVALSFPGCHRKGGVERIVFECARYLASQGHAVDVFANEWEPDATVPLQYQKVPVRHRPGFLKGRSYFQNASKLIENADYDVLSTHGCVCPLDGVHWVQSVHAAWLEKSRELRGSWSLDGLKQRLNPLHPSLLALERKHFQDRRYSKIIATTPQVREDLGRLYGVPSSDVVIIPNGFSPAEFNPAATASRRAAMRVSLSLQPHNLAILFVANELERKGLPVLFSAIAKLNDPSIRVIVAGKPPMSQVMAMAEKVGIASQVIPFGSTPDIAGLHAAADLFVLPTLYEAFCLAILEALGSGLPVITSNIPGARDAIQPGINGMLVNNPLDIGQLATTIQLLLKQDRRAALAANASESVRPYQWPTVLKQYEHVLASCKNP